MPSEPSRAPVRSDLAAAQVASLPPAVDAAELSRRRRSEHGMSLRTQLANLPLFAPLDPATLHELILRARVVVLESGQILFHQGEPSSSLYIVVDGAVTPIAEGDARRKLAVLERGDFVGEIGLVTHQPRNATVAALVDSKLIAIDRGVLFPLMRKEPELARGILQPLRERMLDRQLRTNLFFAAFDPAERGAVARQFRRVEVQDGARIVRQGEPPEGLFVVLAGRFRRVDRATGRELGRLELGDVFGGPSLLEGQPSPCDVVADGKAWVILLGERRFRRIVDENPRLVRVVKRLAQPKGTKGPGAEAASASGEMPNETPKETSNEASRDGGLRASPTSPSSPSSSSSRRGPASSPAAGAAGRARRSRS